MPDTYVCRWRGACVRLGEIGCVEEQGISIGQLQRVESVPIFRKSLHHEWFSCENPNCNKVKARLDSDENRNVLFRSSLSLITLTIAVQDCISVGDHMIRSGFNKSIVTRISEECTLIANPILFSLCCITVQHVETLTFGIYFESSPVFFD